MSQVEGELFPEASSTSRLAVKRLP